MYMISILYFRILSFFIRSQETQFSREKCKFEYFSMTKMDNVWGFIFHPKINYSTKLIQNNHYIWIYAYDISMIFKGKKVEERWKDSPNTDRNVTGALPEFTW